MSPKIKLCREKGCSNQQTTGSFCRIHYLKNWRSLQQVKKKKAAKDLNRYIDGIVTRHRDNSVAVIKDTLNDDEALGKAISNQKPGPDELDTVMKDLGYRTDLDEIFGKIKIDDSF